jgi:hypothetical protein
MDSRTLGGSVVSDACEVAPGSHPLARPPLGVVFVCCLANPWLQGRTGVSGAFLPSDEG